MCFQEQQFYLIKISNLNPIYVVDTVQTYENNTKDLSFPSKELMNCWPTAC